MRHKPTLRRILVSAAAAGLCSWVGCVGPGLEPPVVDRDPMAPAAGPADAAVENAAGSAATIGSAGRPALPGAGGRGGSSASAAGRSSVPVTGAAGSTTTPTGEDSGEDAGVADAGVSDAGQ